MVKDIKELNVEAQFHTFGQGKPLREVEITPGEVGTAQPVSSEAAELTILGVVASDACAGARIDA